MKIERYLSPNCSELGLMITNDYSAKSVEDTIKEIRKHKLEVIINLNGKEFKNVNPNIIAFLRTCVEENEEGEAQISNLDRIKLIGKLTDMGLTDKDAKKLALNMPDDHYDMSIAVGEKRSWVNLLLCDYCSGEKGILFETGDGEKSAFKTMHKLAQLFGGEVYGIDGGHPESYEDWVVNNIK